MKTEAGTTMHTGAVRNSPCRRLPLVAEAGRNCGRVGTWMRCGRGGFTLVETLVSLAVLSVIMLTICRFFANAQAVCTASLNRTELYQSARVLLEIVTSDLQTATAKRDDIPGQHIYLHQPSADSLWYVSVGDAGPAARCSLLEVGWRLKENQIERAFVSDSCTSWNIYGARDDASAQDGYQQVVEGVMSLSFLCYNASSVQYTPTQATSLPTRVIVVVKLMDDKSFRLWQRLPVDQRVDLERRVCRTFRKSVSLTGTGS